MIYVDVETYSSVDLSKSGLYKYTESPDFEILLIAYAIDDGPVEIVDLNKTTAESLLSRLYISGTLFSSDAIAAHNATFERICLKNSGIDIPIDRWHCSMVKAAYCGLPLGLDAVSKALNLGDKSKSTAGKNLIKYFTMPCKSTKTNGGRTRNLPEHDPEKWEQFKEYCKQDVEAERAIMKKLSKYEIPEFERENYILDQQINDRGVLVDLDMVNHAMWINDADSLDKFDRMQGLTGLQNPNSGPQLKAWLKEKTGKEYKSLTKDTIPQIIEETDDPQVKAALDLKLRSSKTSLKKYDSMIACAGSDNRARGLLQFYGANRTGRWAGRLVQLHNLKQNHLKGLDLARETVASGQYEAFNLMYDDKAEVLSQLIRTAFIAPIGKVFAVADFSAIEARVIAWLAGEQWRLDVFNTHGKIYEASASKMFGVPIESITKDSEYRQKGKIAELALGYQGAIGALTTMGGEAMGLGVNEMQNIVDVWRRENPAIVKLWAKVENYAKYAIVTRKSVLWNRLMFIYDGQALRIKLPSGRELFYWNPSIGSNRFGGESIHYKGLNDAKQWADVETYGGKLVENIVQAIARDLLAYSMQLASTAFDIVLHVHDEIVVEIEDIGATGQLSAMELCMSAPPEWAQGLPLNADGFITKYYKKAT